MVILGLGSNIGDRLAYLRAAVQRLSAVVSGIRPSRILESAALLPPGAPGDWGKPFLNMAVCSETSLAPAALLAGLKSIERDLGRRASDRWGPREIDLDILAMDNLVMEEGSLSIPHCELLNRDFALLPLADVAPGWRYPAPGIYQGKTAVEIAAAKNFCLNEKLRDTGFRIDG